MFKPYKYEKRYTESSKPRTPIRNKNLRKIFNGTLLSFIFMFFGIGMMFQKVLLPIAVSYAKANESRPIISPIVSTDEPIELSKTSNDDGFLFTELVEDVNSEIESEHQKDVALTGVEDTPEFFYITIPKLDIYDAKVETNSSTLNPNDAIGHFNGSCLPDEACNTFIYGHSTFKSIKNAYEKGDYREVFSKLNDLEYGDEFYITYNDKKYRYMVDFSKIDEPSNVDPLENPYPKSFHVNSVTLFTCDPPGTTKYRLSVVGKLVD